MRKSRIKWVHFQFCVNHRHHAISLVSLLWYIVHVCTVRMVATWQQQEQQQQFYLPQETDTIAIFLSSNGYEHCTIVYCRVIIAE